MEFNKDIKQEDSIFMSSQERAEWGKKMGLSNAIDDLEAKPNPTEQDKQAIIGAYKVNNGGRIKSSNRKFFNADDTNTIYDRIKGGLQPITKSESQIKYEALESLTNDEQKSVMRADDEGTHFYNSDGNKWSHIEDDDEALKAYKDDLWMKDRHNRIMSIRSNMSERAQAFVEQSHIKGGIEIDELSIFEPREIETILAYSKVYKPKSERGLVSEFFNKATASASGFATGAGRMARNVLQDIALGTAGRLMWGEEGASKVYEESVKMRKLESQLDQSQQVEYEKRGLLGSAFTAVGEMAPYMLAVSNPYTGLLAGMSIANDYERIAQDEWGLSSGQSRGLGIIMSGVNQLIEKVQVKGLSKNLSRKELGVIASKSLDKVVKRRYLDLAMSGVKFTGDVIKRTVPELGEEVLQSEFDEIVRGLIVDGGLDAKKMWDVAGETVQESISSLSLLSLGGSAKTMLKSKKSVIELQGDNNTYQAELGRIEKEDKEVKVQGDENVSKFMNEPMDVKIDILTEEVLNSLETEEEKERLLDELDNMSEQEINDALEYVLKGEEVIVEGKAVDIEESVMSEEVESNAILEEAKKEADASDFNADNESKVELITESKTIEDDISKRSDFAKKTEDFYHKAKVYHQEQSAKREEIKSKNRGRTSALPVDVIAYLALDTVQNIGELATIGASYVVKQAVNGLDDLRIKLREIGVSEKDAKNIVSETRKKIKTLPRISNDFTDSQRKEKTESSDESYIGMISSARKRLKGVLKLSKADRSEMKASDVKIHSSMLHTKKSNKEPLGWDQIDGMFAEEERVALGIDKASEFMDIYNAIYSQDLKQLKKDARRELLAKELEVGQTFREFGEDDRKLVVVHKFKNGDILVNDGGTKDGEIYRYPAKGVVTESVFVDVDTVTDEELEIAKSRETDYLHPLFFKVSENTSETENQLRADSEIDAEDYYQKLMTGYTDFIKKGKSVLEGVLAKGDISIVGISDIGLVASVDINNGKINGIDGLVKLLDKFEIDEKQKVEILSSTKKNLLKTESSKANSKKVVTEISRFMKQVIDTKRRGDVKLESAKAQYNDSIVKLKNTVKDAKDDKRAIKQAITEASKAVRRYIGDARASKVTSLFTDIAKSKNVDDSLVRLENALNKVEGIRYEIDYKKAKSKLTRKIEEAQTKLKTMPLGGEARTDLEALLSGLNASLEIDKNQVKLDSNKATVESYNKTLALSKDETRTDKQRDISKKSLKANEAKAEKAQKEVERLEELIAKGSITSTITDLKNALDDIKMLLTVGKTAFKARQERVNEEVAEKREELKKTDLTKFGKILSKFTGGLSDFIAVHNLIPKEALSRIGLDWMYDRLRKSNHDRLVYNKKLSDKHHNAWEWIFKKDKNGKVTDQMIDDASSASFGKSKIDGNIDLTEGLAIYAYSMDDNGLKNIIKTGYTIEEVERIKSEIDEKFPQVKESIEADFKSARSVYKDMASVYQKLEGKKLDYVQNYLMLYNLEADEVQGGSEGVLAEMGTKRKGKAIVSKGQTHTRSGNASKFTQLDYFNTVDFQNRRSSAYIEMRENAEFLNKFLDDSEVKTHLSEVSKHTVKMLDVLTRQVYNNRIEVKEDPLNKFVDYLRGATTVSTLALNIPVMLKQTASIPNSALAIANELGVSRAVAMGMIIKEMSADPLGNGKILVDGKMISVQEAFPEIAERLDGTAGSLSVSELISGLNSRKKVAKALKRLGIDNQKVSEMSEAGFKKYKTMVELSLKGIAGIDKVTSTAVARVAWNMAKEKGLSDAEASKAVVEASLSSQPSHDILSLSAVSRSENAISRAYNQFLNMPSKIFSQNYHAMINKTPLEIATDIGFSTMAPSIIMYVLGTMTIPEEEEDIVEIVSMMANTSASGIAGGGNLLKFFYGDYKGNASSILPTSVNIFYQQLRKLAIADTPKDRMRATASLLSTSVKAPTTAGNRMLDFFEDGDVAKGLLGKKNGEIFNKAYDIK